MGQIIRTEAVVLRSMAYRETSQIVTLFTREMGKIVVLAKGSRKLKSQFGATLQPMSHIQVVFYYKATRDLQILSESSHVTLFNRLSANLDKMSVGLRMVELVNALVEAEEQNSAIFALLSEVLRHLDLSEVRSDNIWPFFQLRLAGVLGFQPNIERHKVEEITGDSGWLALNSGSILSQNPAAETAQKASRSALRGFAILARAELEAVMRMELAGSVQQEIATLVDRFLRFHLEDALPNRSEKVIGQMKRMN